MQTTSAKWTPKQISTERGFSMTKIKRYEKKHKYGQPVKQHKQYEKMGKPLKFPLT